jgi:hypothetical protein
MYWSVVMSERGQTPTSEICRASMDGSNAVIIVRTGLELVSGLDIDLVAQELYWTDQRRQVIEAVNVNGTKRRTIPIKQVIQFCFHIRWSLFAPKIIKHLFISGSASHGYIHI